MTSDTSGKGGRELSRKTLAERFGFQEFRPGQEEVVEHLLAGRSAAAVFPTGGGKSLCYQLPALLLPGLTLVVSPLIALMKDQIDALEARGIPARRLDSTLGLDEYRMTMDEVRSGKLRLLYVAPERFVNERFCGMIENTRISLFAVDEAHCISQWGHDFRPDYLHIADVRTLLNGPASQASDMPAHTPIAPMLALTATATPRVQGDIVRLLGMSDAKHVVMGFDRPNLTFEVFSMLDASAKQRFIRDFLSFLLF